MRGQRRLDVAPVFFYLQKLRAFAGPRLYASLAGTIAVSLLEGVGIFLLAPMLGLIGLMDASSGSIPLLSAAAKPLQHLSPEMRLPAVLAVFLILLLGQGLLQRLLANLSARLEQGFIRHLRLELYQGLIRSHWAFFLKRRRSDFIHHATIELPRVSFGVFMCLRLATTLLFTLIQIGFALWLSAPLTLAVLACGLALAAYSRSQLRKSRAIGQETTELMQRYVGGMTDHFNGIKDIKGNRMERQHISWFRALCDRLESNLVQFTRLQSASQFHYKAAASVLIAGFVYFAFAVLHVQAETLVLIVLVFSRLWPKFASLQSNLEQIGQTVPAFRHLRELQQAALAAQEAGLGAAGLGGGDAVRVAQGFELRDVYYRYDREQETYALQAVNLRIPSHRMTAVVGRSGAGKSTLIDVLIGLVQPERGQVLVDGKPLGAGEACELRRSVSYVSQDPFLFHESVRDNLAIAAPDASEAQMWEALRFAAADAFVKRLPEGLDTVLGDRGIRLSGGERQRIVLARAILRDPSVLVLDEATSALDGEREAGIQEALERLRGRMTLIVIAHRLSTIRGADQIIVLDNGAVVQQGGYAQLSEERGGLFGKLLSYQARASG
ncbi:ABC transporter ATP-binding protein [Cohnella rhizosphaerae]|uniref:ABC transporter ATP-binding protein/permease n=1 Tax=Cohnella rhizosphaerae TaxID=1457232 RepID=A0A9X4KR49_9BACL|nr:ABC transporter ATP-binding protein [Cohnella rhizosphaerae]MDG0809252.1 ABC transporter ATP-binding protein/permease [Cohnella rhizosphaerae]